MFKLAAFVALMIVSYFLLVTYCPPRLMLQGFTVGAYWIAYWWCAALAYGVFAYRAIF